MVYGVRGRLEEHCHLIDAMDRGVYIPTWKLHYVLLRSFRMGTGQSPAGNSWLKACKGRSGASEELVIRVQCKISKTRKVLETSKSSGHPVKS